MKHDHVRSGFLTRLGKVPLVVLALAASGPLGGCTREQSSHTDVEMRDRRRAADHGASCLMLPRVRQNCQTAGRDDRQRQEGDAAPSSEG